VWRRCEVGTEHWAQCNDSPVKYARFPVTGLVEGRSYMFRVSALNTAGVSRPSRVSDAVVAMDPSDRARQRGEETESRAAPLREENHNHNYSNDYFGLWKYDDLFCISLQKKNTLLVTTLKFRLKKIYQMFKEKMIYKYLSSCSAIFNE
jgi:hypothetical protein